MTDKEKEKLIILLYKTMEGVQAEIESKLDELIKTKNTTEFDMILLNLAEISIQLLRSNY